MSGDDIKTDLEINPEENNDNKIESVTMIDILNEEKEKENECLALLGASDDKYCTYTKGYIKRQALYSCLTCCPDKSAGVCLACSYHCHENHELIELYTKRNFQCDCGNPKMKNTKCTLDPTKCTENELNQYNQNFSGIYCFCHRPFPDAEDSVEDEMIQCIICEDWYHTRHLDAIVPVINNYSEMICGDCMKNNDFLINYKKLMVDGKKTINTNKDNSENNGHVGHDDDDDDDDDDDNQLIMTNNKPDDLLKDEMNQCVLDIINMSKEEQEDDNNLSGTSTITKDLLGKHKPTTSGLKRGSSSSSASTSELSNTNDEPAEKKLILSVAEIKCTKPIIDIKYYENGATFWINNWRKHLCKCNDCIKMYKLLKIEYLLDPDDTVQSYENRGKNNVKETQYERGMRALSSLERTKQVDVITGYNKMKEKLMEFLQTFVINGQVVTEDDINGFFTKMKNEKSTKQNVTQPYFCR